MLSNGGSNIPLKGGVTQDDKGDEPNNDGNVIVLILFLKLVSIVFCKCLFFCIFYDILLFLFGRMMMMMMMGMMLDRVTAKLH